MPIISQKRIADYVSSFASQPFLGTLMKKALAQPLSRDQRYLARVSNIKALRKALGKKPNPKLQQEFKNSAEQWSVFIPTHQLSQQIRDFYHWLETEIHELGNDYRNHPKVRAKVEAELTKIRSIEAAILRTSNPLLTDQQLNSAIAESKLKKPPLDPGGQSVVICNLPQGMRLVRIRTPGGMKTAGKKADNCLGSMKFPLHQKPHRKRVLEPDKWLYFSVRDTQNESIFTITVDRKYGKIEASGNGHDEHGNSPPIDDGLWNVYKMAEKVIIQHYPNILKNVPYGSFQHRIYQDSGYYDLDR